MDWEKAIVRGLALGVVTVGINTCAKIIEPLLGQDSAPDTAGQSDVPHNTKRVARLRGVKTTIYEDVDPVLISKARTDFQIWSPASKVVAEDFAPGYVEPMCKGFASVASFNTLETGGEKKTFYACTDYKIPTAFGVGIPTR